MAHSISNELSSIKLILENDKDKQLIVYNTLKTILENIIKNPNSSDNRKLDLLHPDVVENLMPFSGGLEFLFELGFEESDDKLILPDGVNLERIKLAEDQLDNIFDKTKENTKKIETCNTTIPISNIEIDLNGMSFEHRNFYGKLQGSFNHVLIYEDKNVQAKALRTIPVDRLRGKANEKFNEYKKDAEKSKLNVKADEEMEFFLLELLDWYKNEFFQWVNEPDCDYCQTKEFMKYHSNGQPNPSELTFGARNVEVYKCSKCNQTTRFPRYNHPSKLLDTHKGRCGEWANCFTLCLRALNFEARYVLDWTDHVWSEVYSKSQKRWLHIDPCEAALDKPLIYEHGWGKKLTYVIGFSNEEIVDVTWRYSSKHREVLGRRNECDELWLVKLLNRLNKQRQQNLSNERKKSLNRVTEIVEFLTPKIAKEGEDIGRQSGSLQWRLSRGEMGNAVKQLNNVIKPTENEIKNLRMHLKYNTANNSYSRDGEDSQIKSWNSYVCEYSNIQLKIENDWKMCYLARTEGSSEAFIEWHFDLSDKVRLKEFRLICKTDCFESGEVKWSIVDEMNKKTFEVEKQNGDLNIFSNLGNLTKFKLRVDLRKGNGSNAFQHTQLFRQKLNDFNIYLFDLDFILE